MSTLNRQPKGRVRHLPSFPRSNLDCICKTETCLKSHTHDNVVAIDGFHLVLRDRADIKHGGVCMFIESNINFTTFEDLEKANFEVLWMKLCPARLPRCYSCIVLGAVYYPPSANDLDLS